MKPSPQDRQQLGRVDHGVEAALERILSSCLGRILTNHCYQSAPAASGHPAPRGSSVEEADDDHDTDALRYTRVTVLQIEDSRTMKRSSLEHGEVQVVEHVAGCKKIRFESSETIGFGDVVLPDYPLQTTACWWTPDPELAPELGFSRTLFVDAVAALGRVLHQLATLFLMCDGRDLSRSIGDTSAAWYPWLQKEGGLPPWKQRPARSCRSTAWTRSNRVSTSTTAFPAGLVSPKLCTAAIRNFFWPPVSSSLPVPARPVVRPVSALRRPAMEVCGTLPCSWRTASLTAGRRTKAPGTEYAEASCLLRLFGQAREG